MNKIKSSLLLVGLVALLATPVGFAQAGIEETVFKGCVLSVEDSVGVWSGRTIIFQIVTYEVKEVLSGSLPSSTTIHHAIVMHQSDVLPFEPELNPSIVFPGAGLMITTVPFEGVFGLFNAAFDPVIPDSSISCDDGVVGGEIIPIETTTLILAGAQSFSWMIPVVLSGIGIGLFVVSRKSENS